MNRMEKKSTTFGNNSNEKIKINYLYVDFPPMPKITSQIREKNKNKLFRGSVRLNIGKYRTDEELDNYITKSLKRKLP